MENERRYIFDNPRNVKRVMNILYGCSAVLLLLDFVINRYTIHSWEKLWGFYAIYGFVSCVILVRAATWLRTFIMRPEDYYDDEGKTYFANSTDGELPTKNNVAKSDHDVDA